MSHHIFIFLAISHFSIKLIVDFTTEIPTFTGLKDWWLVKRVSDENILRENVISEKRRQYGLSKAWYSILCQTNNKVNYIHSLLKCHPFDKIIVMIYLGYINKSYSNTSKVLLWPYHRVVKLFTLGNRLSGSVVCPHWTDMLWVA